MDGDWITFLQGVVGAIFLAAAVAKSASRASVTPFLTALGFSSAARALVARMLPMAEGGIGLLLIVGVIPLVSCTGAAILSLAFVVALASASKAGIKEGCRCFGILDGQDHSSLAMVRAALLLLAATVLSLLQVHAGFRWMAASWIHSPLSPALGVLVGVALILAFALLEQVESFHDRRLQVLSNAALGALTTDEEF